MSGKKKNKNTDNYESYDDNDDDVYDAEYIVKHKVENGQTFYRVKWKGWSSRYNTWEPSENILDERLIEHYRKKLEPIKKEGSCTSTSSTSIQKVEEEEEEDYKEQDDNEKKDDKNEQFEDLNLENVDKRILEKLVQLSNANVKEVDQDENEEDEDSNDGQLNDKANNKSQEDELTDSQSSIESNSDLSYSKLKDNHLTKSPLKLDQHSSDYILSKEVNNNNVINDSLIDNDNLSNDSTDCESTESNQLVIDSRLSDFSNDKSSGSESFNLKKRKFDPPGFDHIDHLVKKIRTKVSDQLAARLALDSGQLNYNKPSENVLYSNLSPSKLNGDNKSDFSFQDHHFINNRTTAGSDSNNNRIKPCRPEFLKKKSNLLDQVVITDVTANNTTITVRESKSQKFFFKDNKKVQL